MENMIATQLENSRKDLLDLGLRNTLLNFRTKKNKVEVVDEISKEIYQILVQQNKKMRFKPIPKEILENKE
ncbi:MAG: DUF4011 domain-containing protein [Bacteroidetes bacterium]|nr:DUF4011 domain-containing protein [Bacteroidota bacterium]MBU1114391.1 DUF4011 domain-containing protein [Bacteroidota bacterium]MBU1798314.1 DUF4011 domain-containing protein [Bacteroidota bacterium]